MSKRKIPEERSLPLFDLPLQSEDDEAPLSDEAPLNDAGDLSIGSIADGDETFAEMPVESETDFDDSGTDVDTEDSPASFRDRLLSGLLDLGIQLLVVSSVVVAARAMGLRLDVGDGMPFAILGIIFSFLYWFIPLAFWGQTPGMAWVGNSALSLSNDPLTFGQSVLRWVGALLTLAFAGLPMLLAFRERSLTDRLSDSKTVVF